jgi:hypothetical protein
MDLSTMRRQKQNPNSLHQSVSPSKIYKRYQTKIFKPPPPLPSGFCIRKFKPPAPEALPNQDQVIISPEIGFLIKESLLLNPQDTQQYPSDWVHDVKDEIYTGNWELDMMKRRSMAANYIWACEYELDGLVLEESMNMRTMEDSKDPFFSVGNKRIHEFTVLGIEKRVEAALSNHQVALRAGLGQKVDDDFLNACLKRDLYFIWFDPIERRK